MKGSLLCTLHVFFLRCGESYDFYFGDFQLHGQHWFVEHFDTVLLRTMGGHSWWEGYRDIEFRIKIKYLNWYMVFWVTLCMLSYQGWVYLMSSMIRKKAHPHIHPQPKRMRNKTKGKSYLKASQHSATHHRMILASELKQPFNIETTKHWAGCL